MRHLANLPATSGTETTAVIARVEGADAASGRPLVLLPGGREAAPVTALWTGGEPPDWSACRGLRALVLVADDQDPVLIGLVDPPPAKKPKRVVVFEGEEEVILRCGKSEISLRADGRISVLGGHIVSRSTGVHRIKGASVQIN